MPNPIAHPAAAVPFTKARLVLSALVIGSIAPDFGYFLPVGRDYFMYTLPGLFLYDLPMGLILLWLFNAFAKWPILSLLPVGLQRRLYERAERFSFGPRRHFGVILLSLVVGSFTHIAWDSFTHDYGWIVEHVPFFSTLIGRVHLYDILQNLSTLVGVTLLVYWFFRWFPRADRCEQTAPHFSNRVVGVFIGLAVTAVLAADGLIYYERTMGDQQTLGHFLGHQSILYSALFIIIFFIGIYCLAWMIAFHKTVRRMPGS